MIGRIKKKLESIGRVIAPPAAKHLPSPAMNRMDIPYASRPPVLILGSLTSAKTLLSCLIAFGFRPVAIYSRTESTQADDTLSIDMDVARAYAAETGIMCSMESVSIPIVNQLRFMDMATRDSLPIFVSDIGNFKEEIRFLRYRMRIFEQRILHPATLAGLHIFRAKTFMLAGFPSSGNMIFQSCLNDLLAKNPQIAVAQRSSLESLLSHYALSHWQDISESTATAFDDYGLHIHMAAPCGFGLAGNFLELESPMPDQAGPLGQAGDVVMGGLRMWHHAWANPYHASHEPITMGAAAAYRRQGVECIQIVRHPLDVLVSIAGKLTYHLQAHGLSKQAARTAAVIELMNCDAWVHSMIDALERYYAAVVAAKDQIHILRYEDLLSAPVATIQMMAGFFGATVSAEASQDIWRKWAGADVAGEGHRWEPGEGKWMRFLHRRFAERLIGSKLETAAAALGYDFAPDGFQGPDNRKGGTLLNHRLIALEEGRYSVLVGKKMVLAHEGGYWGVNHKTGMFISGPSHARSAIDQLLASPIIETILLAGSYFDPSPHMSMLEYLSQPVPEMEMADRWRDHLAVRSAQSFTPIGA
jgi:hypothetical protein